MAYGILWLNVATDFSETSFSNELCMRVINSINFKVSKVQSHTCTLYLYRYKIYGALYLNSINPKNDWTKLT